MLTHHAYLLEDATSLFDAYVQHVRSSEHIEEQSPDFFAQKYEKFGIEEARELTARASLKKMGERAIYMLGISSITTEAQQALLKLFEEPQPGLTFIVLTPPGLFIATLQSRFVPYEAAMSVEGETQHGAYARRFLQSSHKERSAMVAELLEDEADVKERVRDFFGALEVLLYKELQKAKPESSKHIRRGLEDIQMFRSYVNDRAPSLKMILEHMAATLPTL